MEGWLNLRHHLYFVALICRIGPTSYALPMRRSPRKGLVPSLRPVGGENLIRAGRERGVGDDGRLEDPQEPATVLYSLRSALDGGIRDACRAGIRVAVNTTRQRIEVTPTRVRGSCGVTP